MTLHLLKLCVGVERLADLERFQKRRLAHCRRTGKAAELMHVTLNRPRRAEDILAGGSLYWVIKGVIRVRQPILTLRRVTDEKGRPACGIVYDRALIEVAPRKQRPFQGWRYLSAGDAPADLPARPPAPSPADAPPAEMTAALKELGLL